MCHDMALAAKQRVNHQQFPSFCIVSSRDDSHGLIAPRDPRVRGSASSVHEGGFWVKSCQQLHDLAGGGGPDAAGAVVLKQVRDAAFALPLGPAPRAHTAPQGVAVGFQRSAALAAAAQEGGATPPLLTPATAALCSTATLGEQRRCAGCAPSR